MLTGHIISLIFRTLFVIMLILNYIVFVFLIWFPYSLKHFWGFIILLLFNIFYIMTLWTTITSSRSDPGQVPLYWGFYIGDPDSKRSRYCLMCNVFKPVRCHHCSMCNRCVLNMDHHCPWINNCIGFYNRKFFIQMVFYVNFTLIYIIIANSKFTYDMVYAIVTNKVNVNKSLIYSLFLLLIYVIDFIMEVILMQFFMFHIKLVTENKTTIETLDHKGKEFNSKFDKGRWENIIEVMGTNKVLWFMPLKLYIGKPKGNGIDWIELEEESEGKEGGNINENNNNNEVNSNESDNNGRENNSNKDNTNVNNNNNDAISIHNINNANGNNYGSNQGKDTTRNEKEVQEKQSEKNDNHKISTLDIGDNHSDISQISGLPLKGRGHQGTASMSSLYGNKV